MSRRTRRPIPKTRHRPTPRPRHRRAPNIPHRAVVQAQQELLEWCPNAEGLSQGDLEHVCWACGGRSAKKLTLCHIERFRPNEAYRPENFIILCDRCHREQPDSLPRETLRYWLSTRESETEYYQRRKAVFIAAFALLRNEFGDHVVSVACEELLGYIKSIMDRYGHNSAGQSPGNWQANAEWGWFAEIHKWCVANKDKVALQIPESESKVSVVTRPGMDGLAAGKPQLGLSSDMFAQHVCAEMAEMNRLQVKARTSQEMKRKQAAGHRVTRPDRCPFGWRMDPADNERLAEAPEEQAAIALIRQAAPKGLSYRGICRWLDAQGVQRRGKRWAGGHGLVKKILEGSKDKIDNGQTDNEEANNEEMGDGQSLLF